MGFRELKNPLHHYIGMLNKVFDMSEAGYDKKWTMGMLAHYIPLSLDAVTERTDFDYIRDNLTSDTKQMILEWWLTLPEETATLGLFFDLKVSEMLPLNPNESKEIDSNGD